MLRPKITYTKTAVTEDGKPTHQEITTYWPPFWHWPWYWWKVIQTIVMHKAQQLGKLLRT